MAGRERNKECLLALHLIKGVSIRNYNTKVYFCSVNLPTKVVCKIYIHVVHSCIHKNYMYILRLLQNPLLHVPVYAG